MIHLAHIHEHFLRWGLCQILRIPRQKPLSWKSFNPPDQYTLGAAKAKLGYRQLFFDRDRDYSLGQCGGAEGHFEKQKAFKAMIDYISFKATGTLKAVEDR